MCIDSVKFLFSDKFTMSVVNDEARMSRSVALGSRRPGSHHSRDRHNSGSGSDRDMEVGDSSSQRSSTHNRIEELEDSPPRYLAGIS